MFSLKRLITLCAKIERFGGVLLYILLGQDDFSIHQALEKIKTGLGDPAMLAANTIVLDPPVAIERLRQACETVPFLAEKRLVIVRGLIERFEHRGDSKTRKPVSSPQAEYKPFLACMNRLPPSTVLVLVDGNMKETNPLLRELSGKTEVKRFPLLKGRELQQWVHKRVTEKGANISPDALRLISELVGGDLWTMSSEIDKLALLARGRRIEETDVREAVSSAQEASVFAMVDAIFDSKVGTAEQLLQQLLQRGAYPAQLLTMISRQLRLIVRAKELKSQGKSKASIQNQLGLTYEFMLDRVLQQGDRYSFARIKDIYNEVLEADLALKTGKYNDELALSILIAEVCQRPSPA